MLQDYSQKSAASGSKSTKVKTELPAELENATLNVENPIETNPAHR